MTRIDQHNLAARITCLSFWKQCCSYFFDWSKKRRDDPSSSMAFRLRRSLGLFSRTPLHRPVSPIASFFVTWCFYRGSPCIRVAEYSATEQHHPPGFTTRHTKEKKRKRDLKTSLGRQLASWLGYVVLYFVSNGDFDFRIRHNFSVKYSNIRSFVELFDMTNEKIFSSL